MSNSKYLSRYHDLVHDLERRGIMPDRPPSLDPMKKGLELLLPASVLHSQELAEKTIVVAGTNGKGTVCATLEALLLSEFKHTQKTVGLYTSPHLVETTERFRIQGEDIAPELFCLAYDRVLEKTQGISLSHFEFLTLMAAWLFYSGEEIPAVDLAILEVGLGGKWDATNAIPHKNCIITSLSLDHQNLLGNSLEEIAENKFGIITAGAKVVHSPFPKVLENWVNQFKHRSSANLSDEQGKIKQDWDQSDSRDDSQKNLQSVKWIPSIPFQYEIEMNDRFPTFILETKWGKAPLSLPGQRAAQNAATALTAFESLGYSPTQHLQALSKLRWPGRMEHIQTSLCPCPVFLSGDHNPAGIKSLLEILPYYQRKHLYILIGIGKDKDRDGILSPLFQLKNTSVYLTETPFKGLSIEEYSRFKSQAAGLAQNPENALREIFSKATNEDMVLVTGSLYLVGWVKKGLSSKTYSSEG